MKQSLFLCLLTILFSCKQNEVLIPNSTGAPDLNFSKAQWVNEYQYDGVFTANRFYTTSLFTASFTFNGAEAKAFNPDKDLVKIDGGFLMNKPYNSFLGFPLSYYSGIVGKALINELPFDSHNRFYFKLDNTATANVHKYNPDLGITWKVIDITIPDTPEMKSKNNLSPKDVPSFLISKGGIKLFPDTIKLASGYTIPKGTNDLNLSRNFMYDTKYKRPEIEFLKYNEAGNLLELIDYSNVSTSCLWGYRNRFPIAEVKNMSYTDIESTLTTATLNNLKNNVVTESVIRSTINNLRTSVDRKVTSYTHDVVYGLKSSTDPSNIPSFYSYDGLERLKILTDKDNNILKSYGYQYAGASIGGGGCTVVAPIITAAPASTGCNTVLTASACSGIIIWSNGQSGSSITVPSLTTRNLLRPLAQVLCQMS